MNLARAKALAKPSILWVDLKDSAEPSVAVQLRRSGYHVVDTSNRVEAIGLLFVNRHFDVVVIHSEPAHTCGADLKRLMQSIRPQVPVLFLSPVGSDPSGEVTGCGGNLIASVILQIETALQGI